MIWVIAYVVIALVLVAACFFRSDYDLEECAAHCIVALVIAAVLNVLTGLTVNVKDDTEIIRVGVTDTTYISAFEENGNYIIYENNRYKYIEQTEKGKTISTLKASRIYFPDEFDGVARIVTYKCKFKDKSTFWWTFVPCYIEEYEIYIPPEGFTTKYKVD